MAGVNNDGADGPRGREEATVRSPGGDADQEDTRRDIHTPPPSPEGSDGGARAGDTVIDRRQKPRPPDQPTQKAERPVDATVIMLPAPPSQATPAERTAVTVSRPHPGPPTGAASPRSSSAPSREQWLALGLLALVCLAVIVGSWLVGRFG